MKEGSLFDLFVLMRSIEPSDRVLVLFQKALKEEGFIGLISWCLDL
jgi:hypothetical protein